MNKVLFFCLFFFSCFFFTGIQGQNKPLVSNSSHLNHLPVFLQDHDLFGTRVFIENRGQFDKSTNSSDKILYALENGEERIYFTSSGLIYKFIKEYPYTEEQVERFEQGKKVEQKKPDVYFVNMDWQGANKNCVPVQSEQQKNYHTYGEVKYNSYGFKKLTYQNIYDHIDIEFVIPEEKQFGIKYNVILHPGADVSDIKLLYRGDVKKIKKLDNGDIVIKTPLEDITEHAPNSYYQGSEELASSFSLKDDVIGFNFQNKIESGKTVIIDPWVTSVTTISASNSGFDVDYDDFGNLFVYGGNSLNCKIAKYSSGGLLIWTFAERLFHQHGLPLEG